jgi:hypothetical protein
MNPSTKEPAVSLRQLLTDNLKTAMKAGDKLRVDTIRLIIAKIKEADVNGRAAGKEVVDADILGLMQGMIKQRAESARIYRDNNRPELAAQEEGEMALIQSYLPAQLDDAAAAAAIAAIITDLGATTPKDMGRVMAMVKEKLTGQMDMTKASGIVKSKLVG